MTQTISGPAPQFPRPLCALQSVLGPSAPHFVPVDAGAPLELFPAVRAGELHALVHGVDVVHQRGPALEHLAAVIAVVAVAAGHAGCGDAAAAHDHDTASRRSRLALGEAAPALARTSGLAADPHVSRQQGRVHEGQAAQRACRWAGDGGHLLAAARALVLGQHGGIWEHQLANATHVGHRPLSTLRAVPLAAQLLMSQEILVVPEEDLAELASYGPTLTLA